MADVRHIGNLKNHHNSAAIGDIATKIGMLIDMKLLKLFSRHEWVSQNPRWRTAAIL